MKIHTFFPGRGRDPYNSATTFRDHVVARVNRDVRRAFALRQFMKVLPQLTKVFINELYGAFGRMR